MEHWLISCWFVCKVTPESCQRSILNSNRNGDERGQKYAWNRGDVAAMWDLGGNSVSMEGCGGGYMCHDIGEHVITHPQRLHDFNDTIDDARPFDGLPEKGMELIEKAWGHMQD